ncbi:ATP-dependent DNA helicase PIF1-like protein [Tanacetum coccineum]
MLSLYGRKIRMIVVSEDAEKGGMELLEYDESQFKIEVFTPQEAVVTIAEFFHGALKKMKTHCIMYARIHRLHKKNGWAYTACKECNRKVDVMESKTSSSSGKSKVTFYCEEHGAVQVASRFKVIIRIIDQSGSAPIVFFNTMINKLSGHTAWELMEKHGMDLDEYWREELDKPVEMIKHFKAGFLEDILTSEQDYMMDGYNKLIYDETSYNKDQLREQHVRLYDSLTSEHKGIYSTVMDAVDKNKGGMFFVYGYSGTGKTYLYKTMSAALCSKGKIVLNVMSSGIAGLLLEVGRTTHCRFAIPIHVVEDSMCHIAADGDLARYLHVRPVTSF